MTADLFAQDIYQPLASRLRPRSLEEFFGQQHLVGTETGVGRTGARSRYGRSGATAGRAAMSEAPVVSDDDDGRIRPAIASFIFGIRLVLLLIFYTLRDARINGYTAASFSSKGDLITAIMNERFKELAFEGHRFFDAKRRNLPIIRLAVDAQNNKTTLESGNFRFLLPIPNSEIQANPLMVQNPGYTN